jgi:hypothetical protein
MVTGELIMNTTIRIVIVPVFLLMFVGCATSRQNLYYWGLYEDSIYNMYVEPGKTSNKDEIRRLEEQIQKTVDSGQFVPPGLHAHLAYLYVTQGDYANAMIHFQAEKAQFPESAHFIDGTIERMKK